MKTFRLALAASIFLLTSSATGSEKSLAELLNELKNETKQVPTSESQHKIVFDTVLAQIRTRNTDEKTQKELLNISRDIRIKLSINTEGELISVEPITNDVSERSEQAIRQLIKDSSPFKGIPDSAKKNADILEFLFTIQAPFKKRM